MQEGEDFGTNADGTKNREYCGFCFKDGRFVKDLGTSVRCPGNRLYMPGSGLGHRGQAQISNFARAYDISSSLFNFPKNFALPYRSGV